MEDKRISDEVQKGFDWDVTYGCMLYVCPHTKKTKCINTDPHTCCEDVGLINLIRGE